MNREVRADIFGVAGGLEPKADATTSLDLFLHSLTDSHSPTNGTKRRDLFHLSVFEASSFGEYPACEARSPQSVEGGAVFEFEPWSVVFMISSILLAVSAHRLARKIDKGRLEDASAAEVHEAATRREHANSGAK